MRLAALRQSLTRLAGAPITTEEFTDMSLTDSIPIRGRTPAHKYPADYDNARQSQARIPPQTRRESRNLRNPRGWARYAATPCPTAPQSSAISAGGRATCFGSVSYTHLRAHETDSYLVCRLLLEKKK